MIIHRRTRQTEYRRLSFCRRRGVSSSIRSLSHDSSGSFEETTEVAGVEFGESFPSVWTYILPEEQPVLLPFVDGS